VNPPRRHADGQRKIFTLAITGHRRTKRLVHLALAIGADSSGAVHSHARRGIAEGIPPAELEHVALLAVTTLGWPQAVRGLTWIADVTSASTGSAGA